MLIFWLYSGIPGPEEHKAGRFHAIFIRFLNSRGARQGQDMHLAIGRIRGRRVVHTGMCMFNPV